MRTARFLLLAHCGAVAVGLAAFALVYGARGGDPRSLASGPAPTVSADATPEPGATPDPKVPFWYVPYINQDRQSPPFRGVLNGFEIVPGGEGQAERTALEVCPETGLASPDPRELVPIVAAPGPLQVDPEAIGLDISAEELPTAFLCKGELAIVIWPLFAAPGTADVNPGGSPVIVKRIHGRDTVIHSAPKHRWLETTVNGLPALVSGPIVSTGETQFGSCFATVYSDETGTMTSVSAPAADSDFCLAVIERLVS